MDVTIKRRHLWCICCETVGCGSKQCIVYWSESERGSVLYFCVYVHWSRCYLWQAVVAQPMKWWVTNKGIICRHVCHPAVICHSCTSRCSVKSAFCRCHYTTCAAAWLYCGLVHTIKSSSQDIFLLLFLWVPIFLWTFCLVCCTSPFCLAVAFYPLLPDLIS
jgi:hypothetical protein